MSEKHTAWLQIEKLNDIGFWEVVRTFEQKEIQKAYHIFGALQDLNKETEYKLVSMKCDLLAEGRGDE